MILIEVLIKIIIQSSARQWAFGINKIAKERVLRVKS